MTNETQQDYLQDHRQLSLIFIHAVIDDLGLNPYEFRVYGTIARRAGKKEHCWPGIKAIASTCKMSEQSVRRSLKGLADKKLIAISHRIERGVSRSNIYTLLNPPSCEEGGGTLRAGGWYPQGRGGGTPQVGEVTKDRSTEREVPPIVPQRGMDTAEEIYQAYPLRVGRKKALASIQKALKSEPGQKLLQTTIDFAILWAGHSLEFCPHPTTWFNQERYLDPLALQAPRDSAKMPSVVDHEKGF